MGIVKDSLDSVLEEKYRYSSKEKIIFDDQYILFFDRLIQVSCIATTILCHNDFNITYIAKKLVYLENNLKLSLDSSQQIFFTTVHNEVMNILQSADKRAISLTAFHKLAFKTIIFCQTLDRNSQLDCKKLADYIVTIRTKRFFNEKYNLDKKILYNNLRKEYAYYKNRGF